MYLKQIANHMGMDRSEVQRVINSLRVKGYPVIGDNEGMHRTHSHPLIVHQAEKMLGQAEKMQEAAAGLLKTDKEDLDEVEETIYELLGWKDLPEEEPLKYFDYLDEEKLK